MKHKFIVEYCPFEDAETAYMYINGREAHLLLWHFDQWLRNEIEYNCHTDAKEKWLQMAREKLSELTDKYQVRIE